jgi:hypothetical protein
VILFLFKRNTLKNIIVLAFFLLLLLIIPSVLAQWPEIKSGYAITTNWHGIDVPIGASVVATAGTTDLNIKKVEFKWKNPSGNIVWDDTIAVSGPLTTPNVPPNVPQEVIKWAKENRNSNIEYLYAQSEHTPNIVGEWGVQAIFYDDEGNVNGQSHTKIKATSFFVIPEITGTIVGILAMLSAYGILKIRKNTHKNNYF